MKIINLLKQKIEEYRYRNTLKKIRTNLLALGFDITQYSDKDIEVAIFEFSKCIKNFGLSTEELKKNLWNLKI